MGRGSGCHVQKEKRNRRSERFIKYSSRSVSLARHQRECALTVTAQIASDIWPEATADGDKERDGASDSDEAEDGDDLEAQVAKELASIKRPRREQRFGEWTSITVVLYTLELKPLKANCQTNTPCGKEAGVTIYPI